MISKKELRKEILARRDALPEQERCRKSIQISKQIIEQEEFQNANKVLLFSSFRSEVDTAHILDEALRQKKDVYYPKVIDKEMEFYQVHEKEDLIEGHWGIPEPKANQEKKFVSHVQDTIFVLMPGAIFDEEGNRIGYGGGYYDKFLSQLENLLPKESICKTAIAFECQMVENGKIAAEPYDIKPDYILTEDRCICVS